MSRLGQKSESVGEGKIEKVWMWACSFLGAVLSEWKNKKYDAINCLILGSGWGGQ